MSASNQKSPGLKEGDDQQRLPFGANEVRLGARSWLLVLVLLGLVVGGLPSLWRVWESIPFEKDFRVPYELSKDYWLYQQWLEESDVQDPIYVVGDSVVWGEYVSRDGTLSAFLNVRGEEDGHTFVNAGVNGLFPLALEGLVGFYGQVMQGRRVLLHCNLLWLTSKEADLSAEKEQRFNHPRLVPQFSVEIPCYRAPFDERLGIVIGRAVPFLGFVQHLQSVYFQQQGLYEWTLADAGDYPPSYPNTYRLPFGEIDFQVPGEPNPDPDRGPDSERHKAWSDSGEGSQRFPWVSLDSSLQWAAFKRLVERVETRGNRVLVVVGPLNRHIMADENQAKFAEIEEGVVAWLGERDVLTLVPEVLKFDLYGDASHPLTEGYRALADNLWADQVFQDWVKRKQ